MLRDAAASGNGINMNMTGAKTMMASPVSGSGGSRLAMRGRAVVSNNSMGQSQGQGQSRGSSNNNSPANVRIKPTGGREEYDDYDDYSAYGL